MAADKKQIGLTPVGSAALAQLMDAELFTTETAGLPEVVRPAANNAAHSPSGHDRETSMAAESLPLPK